MKIRSITYFTQPSYPLDKRVLKSAGSFLQIALPAFVDAGFEVQSARLATVPFVKLMPNLNGDALVRLAMELEGMAIEAGYAYISLGPALPEAPESYALIPEALAATQNAFFSGLMTTPDEQNKQISLQAIRNCAQVIQQASRISADGFTNLRFAALANVPAGAPFFPAAYHRGGGAEFALALEAADLAVKAFSQANSVDEGRKSLTTSVEGHASTLTQLARAVEERSGVRFGGIDFSLAPFPSEELSAGTALERMGVGGVGKHGSLAASAILTEAVDQADFQRAGFCGLFLPLLEDATLARRAAEGNLGVTDLLLYSAVCGTGLDTIPIPGDTQVDQISAVLLDLASLSLRLAKPLTARLMPIPGKNAGDPTDFDFSYFANSRVLPLHAAALKGLLSGDGLLTLHRRRSN